MEHPIEQLQSMYKDLEREKNIRKIVVEQLYEKWNPNWDLGKISVDDLLNLLTEKPASGDIEITRQILGLIVESFQDEQTIPILVSSFAGGHQNFLMVLIIGWFGIRAQCAVPWLIYHVGCGHFPLAARQSLKRIGLRNQKKVFSVMRFCIRDRDSLGFAELLQLIEEQYPDAMIDQEFMQIMNVASESKNVGVRDFLLRFLESQEKDILLLYKPLLEKLAKHPRKVTSEKALQVLRSIESIPA